MGSLCRCCHHSRCGGFIVNMWHRHCRLLLCRWLHRGKASCTGAMCCDQYLSGIFGEEGSSCGGHFAPHMPRGLLLLRCWWRMLSPRCGVWWEIGCRCGRRGCTVIHRDARLNRGHTVHVNAAGCGWWHWWLLHRFRTAAAT